MISRTHDADVRDTGLRTTDPAQRRRVLIVSPSFPPMNTPDLQRARMSLPYYRENGWDPVVLAVEPDQQDASREEALLATLPSDVPVHRCSATPLKLSRAIGLGNLGLRAWLPLARTGARLIRREKIDLVFFTNTQFVTFTLGRLWRRWFGVPYVIYLQDPWRTDYYERPGSRRPPGGWKYQFARLQACVLEGWSFRRMAGLMSVSAGYLTDLDRRYRWFSRVPKDVIRFGASETDLEVARKLPPVEEPPPVRPGVLRLIYTGAAGPITPHAVSTLFEALRRFRAREPLAAGRLRLEFLGTSYAPAGRGQPAILPIAERYGVADQVVEIPHRLGHLQCLQLQASADALLLLGSSDHAYSPSKLYPYYLANRPMLAVVFAESQLERLVQDLACATVATLESTELASNETAVARIEAFFENALAGFPPGSLPTRNDALFQREFLARSLTARQCRLFDLACATSRDDTVQS
jgi:hypothetical protein